MPKITERLKKLRKLKHVTQKELGNYLGVTQNAIFNWENGKTEPTAETIEKIAEYFDVSPSYLMGWGLEEEGQDINIIEPDVEQLREEYRDLCYSLTTKELKIMIEIANAFIYSHHREK